MATASTCDEPQWAQECLKKFKIGPNLDMTMGTVFKHNEIYKVKEIRYLFLILYHTYTHINYMTANMNFSVFFREEKAL